MSINQLRQDMMYAFMEAQLASYRYLFALKEEKASSYKEINAIRVTQEHLEQVRKMCIHRIAESQTDKQNGPPSEVKVGEGKWHFSPDENI